LASEYFKCSPVYPFLVKQTPQFAACEDKMVNLVENKVISYAAQNIVRQRFKRNSQNVSKSTLIKSTLSNSRLVNSNLKPSVSKIQAYQQQSEAVY